MSKFITLGEKAYSFHEPTLGITIARGEVKELTDRQLSSRRIRAALNAGHLRIVTENPGDVKKYSDDTLNKLDNKLKKQVDKGVYVGKISKSYTLEEAKLLAAKHNIELEESDTLETIIAAIADDIKSDDE